MTPAEQIADFVRRHPGEWQAVGSPYVPGGAHNFPDGASLSTAAGYVVLMPGVRGVVVNVSKHGHDAARVGQTSGADILARVAARIADACQIYSVSADTLPPWLRDPVRHQLINRARTLLTSAGISPADAVMAAETLDGALCQRAPVEPTLAAVLAALQAIGMSCRWVADSVTPAAPKPDAVFNRALLDAIKRADHLAYGGSLTADLVQEPDERARILAEVEAWRSVAAALRGMP